ncbi:MULTISPECIES: transposase [unclassified Ruegeria]|uniref:transposase n=1 Tax=unclassified Ruegeria TaxID=2625375 RepID=UPI001ADADED7|nr:MULTISPECIES: transposase [unclassified Ruegeria]MBO9413678.1 transposase [Ruegeria sp. R8_1]MBO9417715.1 transposase [Ruegeria sp. R8_2]
MSDLFWLTDAQMARLEPFFPKSHGKPRVDDRRVLSGIIFINRNGLRWRDAPSAYGPHKTLYNRWKRWSDKGIRACIPGRKQRKKPVKYDKRRYKRRNRIEIMFGRLKDWRRVATRYDRCPKLFPSAIAIAALVIYWL